MDGEDPGDGQLILRSKDNEARVDKYPVRMLPVRLEDVPKRQNSGTAPEEAVKKRPGKSRDQKVDSCLLFLMRLGSSAKYCNGNNE